MEFIRRQTTGRSKAIDVCRGLLFLLMINTHALTIASVPKDHWLFSDYWLPNGWATIAFVVLSGYGIGYIFSIREQAGRDAALISRSKKILAVMFISNFVFSALQELLKKHVSTILAPEWWIGFFTLTTEWTISGVLFPTALVLLCGPAMIRFCQRALWKTLAALIVARIIIALLSSSLASTDYADYWIFQLLLFKGFGGFPVLPFVINGCLGVWLGIFKRFSNSASSVIFAALMLIQLIVYLSSFNPTASPWLLLISSLEAIGKFSWVFALALLLTRFQSFPMTSMIGLIGKFSLGSFIMHRVFIQGLNFMWNLFGNNLLSPAYYYCLLIICTLTLTWLFCILREHFPIINRCFTRLAL
ncbi:MAG: acyltransferase [Betaproteobacteria bacterium]|nr:acyltransferase [Betaproteobacteria bacterium]MCL2885700.1 acyltransferase [Betaproteobacteria bacterium]